MTVILGRPAALLRLLAAVLLTVWLPLAAATPVSAHDELESSAPADGATLETAPAEVVLTFTGDIATIGAQMVVTGPAGEVGDGEVVVDGREARQALTAELPAGDYTVVWRVTSGDGHPISGDLTFTAAESDGSPSVSSPGTASGTSPVTSTEATQDPAPPTGPTATPPTETTTDTGGEQPTDAASPLGTLLAVGLGLLVLAAATVAFARARGRER